MQRYIVFYGVKKTTIHAATSYDAFLKGVAYFRVPLNKQHMLSVHLTETAEGKQVTQVLS